MSSTLRPVDLAPLRERLGLLALVRVVIAAIASGAGFLLPPPLDRGVAIPLLALSTLYAVTCTLVELVRRRLGHRGIPLVTALVLLDGVYLAIVMARSGGAQSVLSFLVLVHVIAVTLLLSFRSGLKTALWHALLLFGISWLQEAGILDGAGGGRAEQAMGFRALALLVVAAAAAWFSSLNETELRRGKAELRALTEMAARMAGTHQPAQLATGLLDGVASAFRFPRAAVLINDGKRSRAFVRQPSGDVAEVEEAGQPAHAAATAPAGAPSQELELVRALDPARHPLLHRALPGAANVAIVPMVAEGQILGALAVECSGGAGARIPARTVDLLGQFAAHAALALRGSALQAEVMRLADTDALTGLANRRVFQLALTHELAVAARRREPCSLILLDIDHFKPINDTLGHQAGDEVLRRVGRALGEAARQADVTARFGGEEFAVILPSCSAAEGVWVAERLRAAVAGTRDPVAVTVSAGVASFPSDAHDEASLLSAADQALYGAKGAGRDQTVRFRRERPVRTANGAAPPAGIEPTLRV